MALQGDQQRADVWLVRENRQLRQLARQHGPLRQAQVATAEDRDRLAEPVAGMLLQQIPHPLAFRGRNGARLRHLAAARLVAAGRGREQAVSFGGQAPQLSWV